MVVKSEFISEPQFLECWISRHLASLDPEVLKRGFELGFDSRVCRLLQALRVATGAWDVNQLLVVGALTRQQSMFGV